MHKLCTRLQAQVSLKPAPALRMQPGATVCMLDLCIQGTPQERFAIPLPLQAQQMQQASIVYLME